MKTLFTLLTTLFFITQLAALTVTVGSTNADYLTDGADDQVQIQAAIDFVASNGGGTVQLHAQTFTLSSRIIPKSKVAILGMGRENTIIKGIHTFDYVIFNSESPVDNFHLQSLTIDASNAQNASGVRLEYATNCVIRKVKFINVTCDGWHLILGIAGSQPEILQADFSRNNLVDNCEFDGHQGSLEMLLVFNTKNTIIQDCTFKNKTRNCPNDGNAPVLGLWQQTDSILIKNCQFLNNESSEAIYYSSSSFNTSIQDCTFNNTGAVRGTNDSDWEAVNNLYPYAEGLKIENCTFSGGSNDRNKMAIQLGGIQSVLIKDCSIEAYEEGITFQGGFTHAGNGHLAPKHWAVINTIIKNCNPNNDVHDLHGGCLFTEGVNLNGFFICGRIYDDQTTQTMRYPLIFETLNTTLYPENRYDSIFILGTELSSIAPFDQIKFNGGVNRGADLIFEDCNVGSPPTFCTSCDTPQSMETYADMMDDYDAVTAQKMLDLSALKITTSTSACFTENITLTIDNQNVTDNYVAASITTSNSVTVTTQATFRAKNFITLSAGFHAQAGSDFLAEIENCDLDFQPETVRSSKQMLTTPTNLTTQKTTPSLSLKVYPNPFSNQFTIDYILPKSGETTIYLSNVFGQNLLVLKTNDFQEKGNYQLASPSTNLEAGVYFIVLKSGTATSVEQLIRL